MLIVDGNNVAYREGYAKAGLSYRGRPTGAIFGFLQQLRHLSSLYPGEICFCWDSRESLRRQFWPDYKANRRNGGHNEAAEAIPPQIDLLRGEILPRLGYPNQFIQDGYEADDLIAAVCLQEISNEFHNPLGPRVDRVRLVIVSSDNDLFQCLGPSVAIHNIGRKQLMTHMSFQAEWGIHPRAWIQAKAIAGDSSDNVVGVPGVGLKTAIKYMKTGLGGGKTAQAIRNSVQVIERNHRLVALPWDGANPGPIQPSYFSEREFMQVCAEYGLQSLLKGNKL